MYGDLEKELSRCAPCNALKSHHSRQSIIVKLRRHFAVHGILQTLMTDNAQQFVCSNFSDFARAWDFKHIRSIPYYPQSNGLTERAVRSAKHLVEKCYREHIDIQAASLLLRNLSQADLPSPAELLFSRHTRTFLLELKDRLKPSVCCDLKAVFTRKRKESKAY